MAKLSPTRTRLAAAIAAHGTARDALATAVAARDHAEQKAWEASDALDAAREAQGKAGVDAAGFIDSFATGTATDAVVLDRPRSEAERAAASAEHALSTWRATAQGCQAEIDERQLEVGRRKAAVDAMAAEVIRDEAPTLIRAALDGFDQLAAELRRRAMFFKTLDRRGLVPRELAAVVDAALVERGVFLPAKRTVPANYDHDEIVLAWDAALDRLRTDPAAALPGAVDR